MKIKLIVTILLLVFVAASLVAVFMRGGSESDVEQAAAVDAVKVRAHLRNSVDETYRKELADAAAVTSWEERERLREAAETAHQNRLSRIEAVVTTFAEIAGGGTAIRFSPVVKAKKQ